MPIKKIFIGLLFFLVSMIFITKIFAQETPVGIKSQPVPFSIEAMYIICEDNTDPSCVPYPTNITEHPDLTKKDHEFGLYADGLPGNTDVYVVGCYVIDQTTGGTRCTTGDQNLDNILNSYPGGDQMVLDSTLEFKALQNPVKTNAGGIIENAIVRSFTSFPTIHSFFAYYIDTQTGGAGEASPAIAPSVPAVQQGTIDFNTITPSPQPRPRPPRPRLMNDPKGRFFDARSLEPIPEGEVTLLNNLKKIFVYSNLINPQAVKINGEFNFWVPNGIYYFQLNKLPTGYIWPIKIGDVHSSYLKAYYCDPEVKNESNQSVPLYTDQYSIIENNKLVHCDVPLDPGTKTPYRSDVQTVKFSISKTDKNLATLYLGQVTHPLTVVSLKGEETEKIIASKTADKFGYWEITLPNSNYPLKTDGTPDRLIAVYKKTDLTGSTQPETVEGTVFEPLLNYVEGYTYDDVGQIMPLAKVGYKQQATEKIVYLTTADNQGYFKIPTRYLPSFGYDLVFLAAGQTTPVISSTSKFATKNADYLKQNNTNLLTKTSKELINPKSIPAQTADKSNNLNQKPVGTTEKESKTTSQIILVGIIIFIIIAFAALIAAVVIFKKNQTPTPPSL